MRDEALDAIGKKYLFFLRRTKLSKILIMHNLKDQVIASYVDDLKKSGIFITDELLFGFILGYCRYNGIFSKRNIGSFRYSSKSIFNDVNAWLEIMISGQETPYKGGLVMDIQDYPHLSGIHEKLVDAVQETGLVILRRNMERFFELCKFFYDLEQENLQVSESEMNQIFNANTDISIVNGDVSITFRLFAMDGEDVIRRFCRWTKFASHIQFVPTDDPDRLMVNVTMPDVLIDLNLITEEEENKIGY